MKIPQISHVLFFSPWKQLTNFWNRVQTSEVSEEGLKISPKINLPIYLVIAYIHGIFTYYRPT